MWILSNFDLFIFIIVLTLSILPTLRVCTLIYSLVTEKLKNRKNLYRWKNGIITLDDLNHLTPAEFQYWCGDFIKKLGFTDIIHSKLCTDGINNIKCRKFGETAYILCVGNITSSKSRLKVDEAVCKQLVGTMVQSEVTSGMIITCGSITDNAIKYINTLPQEYRIQLLDGNDIIRQYSFLHERKYKTI
jgi:hypothetical protein